MDKELKFLVTFNVPVLLKVKDNAKPDEKELQQVLSQAAIKRLNETTTIPYIEAIYEAISKDEVGQNQITRNNDHGPDTGNNVGAIEGKNADNPQKMPGDEQGQSERNKSGTTGEVRNEIQDRQKNEGGVQTNSPSKE